MDQAQIQESVVKILTPWVKNEEALKAVSAETNILDDLKVNSARLVDVVIAFEVFCTPKESVFGGSSAAVIDVSQKLTEWNPQLGCKHPAGVINSLNITYFS